MIGDRCILCSLKSYLHLHPLSKAKSSFVDKKNYDENINLEIFEIIASTYKGDCYSRIVDISKVPCGCKRHQMLFGMVKET